MKVLVIEDDPGTIEVVSLCFQLRWSGTIVISADSGSKGVELVETESPNVVILDIGLPDMDGYQVLREIRRFSDVPVLMLTVRGEDTDVARGLELGADDYVVKPYSLRELISRIRALLRRAYGDLAAVSEQEQLTFGEVEMDLKRLQVYRQGRLVDLTPTEFRLLRYLVANPDRPFSRSQLIEAVWGYESDIGYDRTVDVHMRHLRKKLEDDPSNPRWLVTVRGIGYKFEP